MKDELAEKLLVTVMDWDQIRCKEERAVIQDMARYKYDEYQQFAPGMRFVESLARWLFQFKPEHREAAYQFVKKRLIFCSSAEMSHLVSMVYPDRIRPHLMRSAATDVGVNSRHVARIATSTEFRIRQRQCLFLGLSDGARIDVFRRSNSRDLSHEQILRSHEVAEHRINGLLDALNNDLREIDGRAHSSNSVFRTLVLMDDFSASGLTYYMPKLPDLIGGKLFDLYEAISNAQNPLSRLFRRSDTQLFIVLYVATAQARQHLEKFSKLVWGKSGVDVQVEVVQLLPESIRLNRSNAGDMVAIIEQYYDHSIHNLDLEKGGTSDSRYGFADCGLPVVMHHNSPNNSVALLWSYDDTNVRGLFPRVRRHKSGK